MPTPTDLVTDLPADFNVFGQAVDNTFVDLKGGTIDQILAKNSNDDMDFTWITNDVGDITAVTVTSPITGGGTSGSVGIAIQDASTAQKGSVQLSDSTSTTSSVLAATPTAVKSAYDLANAAIAKSVVTTAGDIIYRNGTVPTRLAIGTAAQILRVNSGATAPEWATVSSGSFTKITSASFSAVANVSLPNGTFSSTYRNYKIIFTISNISTAQTITGRYRISGTDQTAASYYGANTGTRMDNGGVVIVNNNGATAFTLGYTLGAYQAVALDLTFFSPNEAVRKQFSGTGVTGDSTFNNYATRILAGQWITASACDSFTFIADTGTITGTVRIYGFNN